jgi:cytochrome P450
LAVSYNPFSIEHRANPYPAYAALRKEAPVLRLEGMEMFVVSRYQEVVEVLQNPGRYSSMAMHRLMMGSMTGGIQNIANDEAQNHPDPKAVEAIRKQTDGTGIDPVEMLTTPSIVATDPPDHARLRGIVNRAFTPRRIALLEARAREIASQALDRMLEKDEFDLVAEYNVPFPVTVIAELLGVESDRLADFKRWSDVLIAGSTGLMSESLNQQVQETSREFNRYFLEQIERRRRDPKDDLISILVAAESGEAALTPVETLRFASLLLVAGNETTTNLMGNVMLALMEAPEALARLEADPSLIPALVEEGLRRDGPVHLLFREATRDLVLADVEIPKGAFVMPILASANRDESQFPDPDVLDLDRDTRGHVALGMGVHFCLGASLARLEARVGFEELFKRAGKFRLQEPEVEFVDSFLVRGPKRLAMTAKRI